MIPNHFGHKSRKPQPAVKPDDEALVERLVELGSDFENATLMRYYVRAVLVDLRAQGLLTTPEEIKAIKRKTVDQVYVWITNEQHRILGENISATRKSVIKALNLGDNNG